MSEQSSPSLSVRLYKTLYTITNSERESLSGAVHLRGSQRLQLEKWTKKLTGVGNEGDGYFTCSRAASF
ncbi:hypothetical protein B0O99DRAFT_646308 [Bisporella sp. PMI_857]|nr:hypothetical protein B0O99DRAFT_646308 [Bisporella sp. PMI_857]